MANQYKIVEGSSPPAPPPIPIKLYLSDGNPTLAVQDSYGSWWNVFSLLNDGSGFAWNSMSQLSREGRVRTDEAGNLAITRHFAAGASH